MPPFRTYLVMSIVFFLVAFFDPKEEFGILFGANADAPVETGNTGEEISGSEEIRNDVMRPLVEDTAVPSIQSGVTVVPGDDTLVEPAVEPDSAAADESAAKVQDTDGFNIQIKGGKTSTTGNCDEIETEDWPEWLETRLTAARLKNVCERVVADNGKAFLGKLLDNVPAALIALLPIMAFVLKALYPLSKRYYVEHVLFVVHYHAFVFLILSLQILFSRMASLLGFAGSITGVTTFAVTVYIPLYLLLAMRRVYEQGWFMTILKYIALLFAYFGGMIVILVSTAAVAAFSI
jgi:hypothetical protein